MFADSTLPCFMVYGEHSANQLRDRFQPTLTHAFIGDHINKLIDSSLGSHWTRLYDSVRSTSSWVQTYSNVEAVSILFSIDTVTISSIAYIIHSFICRFQIALFELLQKSQHKC